MQSETQSEKNTTAFSEETANQKEYNNKNFTPELLHDPKGLNNRIFYVYGLAPRTSDSEMDQFMSWEFVASEDK